MLQVESTGEALITIGGPGGWGPELLTEAELAVILKRVEKVMSAAFADMTILRQRKVPSNSEAAGELLTLCIACSLSCHTEICSQFGKHWQCDQLCQLSEFTDADTKVDTTSNLCMTREMVCRECYGRCSGEGKSQSWCSVSSRVKGSHHWQCGLWQVYHGKSHLSSPVLSWFRQSTSLNFAIQCRHVPLHCWPD